MRCSDQAPTLFGDRTDKESAVPKGGKREGAGRPSGTGPYAESARSIRVPYSLLGPVSEMVAEHLRSVAAERRVSEKAGPRQVSFEHRGAATRHCLGDRPGRRYSNAVRARRSEDQGGGSGA